MASAEDPVIALEIARGCAGRIERLARDGTQVIVLPEKMTGVTPELVAVLADAARSARVTVVAGLNRVGIDPLRNVAIVPGPETGYLVGGQPGPDPAFALSRVPGVARCPDCTG